MSINSGNNFMKNKKYNYDEKMNRDTYDECNNGSEHFNLFHGFIFLIVLSHS